MNILIVEDEMLIAEMLKVMLSDLGHTVKYTCSSYEGVFNILNENNNNIDLIFLDINLEKDKSGIDIGKKLHDKYQIPFIYLTSYSNRYTIKQATETLPENYLTKPFNEVQLFSALQLIEQKFKTKERFIVFKESFNTVKLKVSEILYIKTDGNYIELKTKQKKYLIREPLENMLQKINFKYFVRTHRSYAVNLKNVKKIHNQTAYLIDDTPIAISRKYKEVTLTLFNDLA